MPRALLEVLDGVVEVPGVVQGEAQVVVAGGHPEAVAQLEEGLTGVHQQPDGDLGLAQLGQQHRPVVIEARQHGLVAEALEDRLGALERPEGVDGSTGRAQRLGEQAVAGGDHLGLGALLQQVVAQPVEPVDGLVDAPQPDQRGRGHTHGPVGGAAVALRVEAGRRLAGDGLGLGEPVVEGEGLRQVQQRRGQVGVGCRIDPGTGARHPGALGAVARLAALVRVAHRSGRVTVPIPGRTWRPAVP